MERAIGEVFELEGLKVKCVKSESDNDCPKCFYMDRHCFNLPCAFYQRSDETDVYFIEVEPIK